MGYKESIITMLEKADEQTLKLIWKFVRAVLGKKR